MAGWGAEVESAELGSEGLAEGAAEPEVSAWAEECRRSRTRPKASALAASLHTSQYKKDDRVGV